LCADEDEHSKKYIFFTLETFVEWKCSMNVNGTIDPNKEPLFLRMYDR